MAETLELARRQDFLSDIDTLSLLGFSAGWTLAENGWQQAVPDGDQPVVEALTLNARGLTHDALATALQSMAEKLRQVQDYEGAVERYSVWLRAKLGSETGTRQVFVHSAQLGSLPLWQAKAKTPSGGYYYLDPVVLALTRSPYWEDTSARVYTYPAVSTVAGTFDYTTYGGSPGAVVGDVPARLALTTFTGVSGGGGPLYEFWLGFKSTRFGNRANFQPYWSLRKSGTFDADTTGGTTNVDATAKDGYKTITTFGTVTSLAQRAKILTANVTSNYSDQRGTYGVLLRAKITGTAVCRVRLSDGLNLNAAMNPRARVVISITSWKYYGLGTVQIPTPGRLVSSSGAEQNYALQIDAERVSGAGNLEMDCLVLLPKDDGFIYANGGVVSYPDLLYVQHLADGAMNSMFVDGGGIENVGTPRVIGGLPVGNGIAVLAAQRSAGSTLTDTLTVTMQVFQRWLSLRGSE